MRCMKYWDQTISTRAVRVRTKCKKLRKIYKIYQKWVKSVLSLEFLVLVPVFLGNQKALKITKNTSNLL